jgi:hypothetical protein
MGQHDIGARVNHTTYGDGTIREINEYHTRIDFDGVGLRTFATPMVVLQPGLTPAPEKPVRKARPKAKPKVAAVAKAAVESAPVEPAAVEATAAEPPANS